MSDEQIHVVSGVSAFTGKGFVTIRWGSEQGQLSPEEAVVHGLGVIEAALASRHDAAVMELLGDIGIEDDKRVMFLAALREKVGDA